MEWVSMKRVERQGVQLESYWFLKGPAEGIPELKVFWNEPGIQEIYFEATAIQVKDNSLTYVGCARKERTGMKIWEVGYASN